MCLCEVKIPEFVFLVLRGMAYTSFGTESVHKFHCVHSRPPILGTFRGELGCHPTWVLSSPVTFTLSLRGYSAPTLEKIASRF